MYAETRCHVAARHVCHHNLPAPTDSTYPSERDQRTLSWLAIPGVDDHEMDFPVLRVKQQVIDMSDGFIKCKEVVAYKFDRTA